MKLRRLILSGFKSFADRTELEFHDDITCIVGPNGCGKSNIVDAIKWVLGEQSAKSLRGAEMMDVIFNGSATRRASGAAEVTLVFADVEGALTPNIDRQRLDGDLVSVTRRLYRGGHSEYLINNVLCRLRDVRDMFMDTGIGVDAYSVIEQGRVEMFLNASTQDRRGVFDEAAGISKYKARKKEALRKLERVDQDLFRVNDILGEVEKRLRSVKLQAGRARSHQTHTDRLKELKGLHYLANYHRLSQQRTELQTRLDAANDHLTQLSAELNQLEAAHRSTQVEAADLQKTSGDLQGQLSATDSRRHVAVQRQDMLVARVAELTEHLIAASRRCEELEAKLADVVRQAAERQKRLYECDAEVAALDQRYEGAHEQVSAGERAMVQLESQLQDEQDGTIDLLRRTAQLHSDVQTSAVRRENLHSQHTRLAGRAKEITETLDGLLAGRSADEAKLTDVRDILADSQRRLDDTRRETGETDDKAQALQTDLTACREQRSGLLSRIETLQEMLVHLEGVSAGTREVLAAARSGALSGVRGMLGDVIETDVDHAGVIEAALAGADQYLLAERWSDVQTIVEDLHRRLGERGVVDLICLDRLAPLAGPVDSTACPQAIAHVIDWMRFEPWASPVIWRLLGKTLVVATLADAVAAAAVSPEMRFVTLDGQVLEPDGRVRLGSAHRGAGVIRRRSELTTLRSDLAELDRRIEDLEARVRDVDTRREHLDERRRNLRTVIYEANTERVELEGHVGRLGEQIDQLQREEPIVASDLTSITADIDAAVRVEHNAREKAAELEQIKVEREQAVERLSRQIAAARQRQGELNDQLTQLKMSRAQMGEKKQALADALRQLAERQQQMQADLDSHRGEITANRQRREETERAIAEAKAEIAELAARRERLAGEVEEAEISRRSLAERLVEIQQRLQRRRADHDSCKDRLGEARTELGEVDVRIENVISRATDEMGMDLVELGRTYDHDEQRDWDAVAAEIAELRQKIERLGNVNLDAIDEQEELQQRQEFLSEQLADVAASQKKLTELIDHLNAESRQRFCETFEGVRQNFQQMFRRMFGGGKADLILLDEEDVLECGIEIVARPPGKELRSLTLLSGGEKAKTALALIFAFFAARPSPFCLLDEVDAPLDEANTEQFAQVLRDFSEGTQFIIISHAKRTMSMVDALYGVTMQEPGVSKRISVRFEDAAQMAEEAPAAADEQLTGAEA